MSTRSPVPYVATGGVLAPFTLDQRNRSSQPGHSFASATEKRMRASRRYTHTLRGCAGVHNALYKPDIGVRAVLWVPARVHLLHVRAFVCVFVRKGALFACAISSGAAFWSVEK